VNLYFVLSEELQDKMWICREGNVFYYEPYCIAELVIARNHSQARYLAWKNDNSYGTWPCILDMPKFSCKIIEKGLDGEARIVSHNPIYRDCWEKT